MATLNCILLVTMTVFSADDPGNEQIRATVQQSIPYIQDRGVWWMEEKKCVSCHRVNNMLWSLNEARRRGYEVSDQLDEWEKWAVDQSVSTNDKGKVVGLGNKEGVAQTLLGLNQDSDHKDARLQLAALLLNDQQKDGSWKAGGQLPSQKRPKSETGAVSTMWLTLAIIDAGVTEESRPIVKRTAKYLEQTAPGSSTEWFAASLLLATQADDAARREQFINALREQQQSDGGWGWLVGDESDALGTGLALYALARSGISNDDALIRRAQQFLVSTQQADGSWLVHGTKTNKKDKIEETATYWGTTWAVLGLMESLPVGAR